jgi:hypothetical protein
MTCPVIGTSPDHIPQEKSLGLWSFDDCQMHRSRGRHVVLAPSKQQSSGHRHRRNGKSHADGELVSVVLSDQPVDANEFASDTRTAAGEPLVAGLFEGAWKSQHIARKLSGVTFTIGPRGLMSEEFLVGGRPCAY